MVSARRRVLCLAMLALAAPVPAFAISELSSSAEGRVAKLSVSTSLGSCGVLETQVVCTLNVTFEPIPEATGYSATVTRADGSVADMGSIGAGGAALYVPYVGSGIYSVRVTAYGAPAELDEPREDETREEVIATDVAEPTRGEDEAERELEEGAAANVQSEPSCVEPASGPDTTKPGPLPEEPPEDLDPNDPDEDADGILDEQERVEYDFAVAARDEAASEATAQDAPDDC